MNEKLLGGCKIIVTAIAIGLLATACMAIWAMLCYGGVR